MIKKNVIVRSGEQYAAEIILSMLALCYLTLMSSMGLIASGMLVITFLVSLGLLEGTTAVSLLDWVWWGSIIGSCLVWSIIIFFPLVKEWLLNRCRVWVLQDLGYDSSHSMEDIFCPRCDHLKEFGGE